MAKQFALGSRLAAHAQTIETVEKQMRDRIKEYVGLKIDSIGARALEVSNSVTRQHNRSEATARILSLRSCSYCRC